MGKKIILSFILVFSFFSGYGCAKKKIIVKETPFYSEKKEPPKLIIDIKKENEEEKKIVSKSKKQVQKNPENEKQSMDFDDSTIEVKEMDMEKPVLVNMNPNDLIRRIEKMINSDLSSLPKPSKNVLELKDIHFDYDKASLTGETKEILKKNGELLKGNENIEIFIEGHCDERGTSEYNLALGEKRAVVVKEFLVSLGVPKDRINTISFGEEKPFNVNHDEDAWFLNRRAHFEFKK